MLQSMGSQRVGHDSATEQQPKIASFILAIPLLTHTTTPSPYYPLSFSFSLCVYVRVCMCVISSVQFSCSVVSDSL